MTAWLTVVFTFTSCSSVTERCNAKTFYNDEPCEVEFSIALDDVTKKEIIFYDKEKESGYCYLVFVTCKFRSTNNVQERERVVNTKNPS